MASPHTLDFMKKNPHCAFCLNSYVEFFRNQCKKRPDDRIICAKECAYYTPKISEIKEKAAE